MGRGGAYHADAHADIEPCLGHCADADFAVAEEEEGLAGGGLGRGVAAVCGNE